ASMAIDVLEMCQDGLRALAAAGDVDHHFGHTPYSSGDVFDLGRRQPIGWTRTSLAIAHEIDARTPFAKTNRAFSLAPPASSPHLLSRSPSHVHEGPRKPSESHANPLGVAQPPAPPWLDARTI